MAIVARTLVEPADQAAHDRLQQGRGRYLAIGWPACDGLMVHLGYPSDRGFLIVEVWRSEDALRSFVRDVMEPPIAAAGLAAREAEIWPVWSLARP